MKTTNIINWRSDHDVLISPMSEKKLRENMSKNGRISTKLLVNFNDIVANDQEWLNDEISERITTSVCGLVDISYSVAGRTIFNEIIIKVNGEIDFENI